MYHFNDLFEPYTRTWYEEGMTETRPKPLSENEKYTTINMLIFLVKQLSRFLAFFHELF